MSDDGFKRGSSSINKDDTEKISKRKKKPKKKILKKDKN
jgi:hypothetical protein